MNHERQLKNAKKSTKKAILGSCFEISLYYEHTVESKKTKKKKALSS